VQGRRNIEELKKAAKLQQGYLQTDRKKKEKESWENRRSLGPGGAKGGQQAERLIREKDAEKANMGGSGMKKLEDEKLISPTPVTRN